MIDRKIKYIFFYFKLYLLSFLRQKVITCEQIIKDTCMKIRIHLNEIWKLPDVVSPFFYGAWIHFHIWYPYAKLDISVRRCFIRHEEKLKFYDVFTEEEVTFYVNYWMEVWLSLNKYGPHQFFSSNHRRCSVKKGVL